MAKKKSLRVLSEELKGSNQSIFQSIDSLNKRMDFIENTSLAIMEILRRKGTGSNQLDKGTKITPAKKIEGSGKIAKDPLIKKQDDGTVSGVLSQLYIFLTKKSEKEDKERKERKDFEKQKTKEIEKRYEKAFKSYGFNFKKRGIIGKTWTGLKWTTIGLAIGGLVWFFKEEILKVSESLKEDFKSFGEFLKEKFSAISSIFNSVQKIITESPIYKTLKEQFDKFSSSITEGEGIIPFVTKKFDGLLAVIETTAKTIYDDISAWMQTLIDPIIKFMEHPLEFMKDNASTISKMGILMTSGPIGMSARVATIGGAGVGVATKAGEIYSRKAYGNESYEKTKNFLDSIPDQLVKRVVAEFLTEKGLYTQRFLLGSRSTKLSEDDKSRIIDLLFQYPELKERLAGSRLNQSKYFNKIEDIAPNVLEQMGVGETRQESFERQTGGVDAQKFKKQKLEEMKEIDLSMERWAMEKIIQNLEGYEFVPPDKSFRSGITILETKTNTKINSVQDPLLFAKLVAKASFYDYIGQKKQEYKNKFNEFKNDTLNHPWVKTLSEELENLEKKSIELKQTYIPQATSAVTSARETVTREVTSAYQGADTPEKKVSSTVGLLGTSIGAAGDLLMEKAGPSAKKIDLSKIIDNSFKLIESSFTSAAELSSKVSQPGGMQELINQLLPAGKSDEVGTLLPELKKDTIAPDPNDDPNNIWSGIRDAFGSTISNNVMNSGKSTSKTQHQGSINSRMNNPSFQTCSVLNTCRL